MRATVALALLPAVALFAAAEIALRALRVAAPEEREEIFAGFAGSAPLFYATRSGGKRVYRTSPNRLEYFNAQEFDAKKPPGTVRVFAIGGSTTFGEPWGHDGSYARFLERALAARIPGARFEVINAGGKGYGSTANLETAREVLRYEPDALVVFAGHNEFREAAFHPTEREGRSSVPRWRALLHRHSRVYVTMRRALRAVMPRSRGAQPTSYATRQIAEILARPFGAELFRFPSRLAIPPLASRDPATPAVMARFGENLRAIEALARERGVPCIVMTLVRNEAFWFVPNQSELEPDGAREYEARYRNLLDAVTRGEYPEALALADSVRALYTHDDDKYLRVLEGDLLMALGRFGDARRALELVWREDPTNREIRECTERGGSLLVDTEAIARAAAPDSILGFAVFYDELHPTPQVHRALGAAIADSMVAAGPGWAPAAIAAALATAPPADLDPRELALPAEATAEVLAYESLRALYSGDIERAAAMADSALVRDPSLGKAQVYRGICAARRGDAPTARAAWDALARLYPELLPPTN